MLPTELERAVSHLSWESMQKHETFENTKKGWKNDIIEKNFKICYNCQIDFWINRQRGKKHLLFILAIEIIERKNKPCENKLNSFSSQIDEWNELSIIHDMIWSWLWLLKWKNTAVKNSPVNDLGGWEWWWTEIRYLEWALLLPKYSLSERQVVNCS